MMEPFRHWTDFQFRMPAVPRSNWALSQFVDRDYEDDLDEFNDFVEQGLIDPDRVILAGLREEYKHILHMVHRLVLEQRRHGPFVSAQ